MSVRRAVLAVLAVLVAGLAVPLVSAPPAVAAGVVTVSVVGQGAATASGITCNDSGGPDCSQFYPNVRELRCEETCTSVLVPQRVTLTAGPDANGFAFQGWEGCDTTSARECVVEVDGDRSPIARYVDVEPPQITALTPTTGVHHNPIPLTAQVTDNSGEVSFVSYSYLYVFTNNYIGSSSTSPWMVPFHAPWDGPWTVTATATDASGNVSPGKTGVVSADNTPPTLTVEGPDGQTFGEGGEQSWTFQAGDPSGGADYVDVACSLMPVGSEPAFSGCSNGAAGHTASGLPGGVFDLRVRATNGAGLATTVSRSFTVDAAPVTSVLSGPAHASRVRTRTVRFGLGSTEPSTFECRLSPSGITPPAFVPCSGAAAHTAVGLADGTYEFAARATDDFGNVDVTPVSRRFTVDTRPPQTVIRTGPSGAVRVAGRTARVRFALGSERGARFRCRLDSGPWRSCTSRPAYVVRLGAHTVRVAAVDVAGNVDRTPAIRRWTVRRR